MCDADDETERRRQLLEDRQARAQDAYDQALFKLSGGALGLSFVFMAQIAGDDPRMVCALGSAWGLWIVSLVCVLWSHYSSERAMDKAIEQLDAGRRSDGRGVRQVYGLAERRRRHRVRRCRSSCRDLHDHQPWRGLGAKGRPLDNGPYTGQRWSESASGGSPRPGERPQGASGKAPSHYVAAGEHD